MPETNFFPQSFEETLHWDHSAEASCIGDNSGRALNARPSFPTGESWRSTNPAGTCMSRNIKWAEKMLDMLLLKANAGKQICSPLLWPKKYPWASLIRYQVRVACHLKARQKLFVCSLPSLEPKHIHSSGKPEGKPASYFHPFLARQIWHSRNAALDTQALCYFCYNNKWSHPSL